ncbi:DUF3025 domain-containing protein [Trinickia dinghuensis]|uniref:DUF3025 domain-containing protein n=1 Tax=Trinickia dinghuensis TaxID=2291023 RepID=A0A3D8JPG8_9BURK|nr:DUF3025 domain-containing protein [Trinickia dinghuensis]RDU94780.1 DUF3025 domain-containing protein [Trinickia dinghuensis]
MTRYETFDAGALEDDALPILGLDRIDWDAPWLAPYAERGMQWQRSAQADPSGFVSMLAHQAREAGQVTGNGRPLSFIEQDDLPAGAAYEAHIAETGAVPTRRNLHDFFNALVWFTHPRVKATLNAHQSRAIERDGIKGARGAERDFLTLFDENAVLFVCADPNLSAALTAFDWKRLFIDERAAWGQRCEARIFGHALLEKLIAPYKACTGHAWIVGASADYFGWSRDRRDAWLDEAVAESLTAGVLDNRRYAPLPVLGVPGFWATNADAAFYDDAGVFRPGRRASRSVG